jgi:hypothetical protein
MRHERGKKDGTLLTSIRFTSWQIPLLSSLKVLQLATIKSRSLRRSARLWYSSFLILFWMSLMQIGLVMMR